MDAPPNRFNARPPIDAVYECQHGPAERRHLGWAVEISIVDCPASHKYDTWDAGWVTGPCGADSYVTVDREL